MKYQPGFKFTDVNGLRYSVSSVESWRTHKYIGDADGVDTMNLYTLEVFGMETEPSSNQNFIKVYEQQLDILVASADNLT